MYVISQIQTKLIIHYFTPLNVPVLHPMKKINIVIQRKTMLRSQLISIGISIV